MKLIRNTQLRATVSAATIATLLLGSMVVPAVAADAGYAVYNGPRILVAAKMRVNGQRIYGNSPYICTPSGFGQKARCYLRSTLA